MASLQARHQRSCRLHPWTPFDKATREAGCTCKPSYYVVHQHERKLIRDPVGRNRKNAERALKKREVALDEGEFQAVENKPFDEWADEWLELKGRSPRFRDSSHASYAVTLEYAKAVFGRTKVRSLRVSHIDLFVQHVRGENTRRQQLSDATVAKHLRHLGACLESARRRGYAATNPVRLMDASTRPQVEQSEPNYFTDAELARLWPELAERPVYLALCKTAVATGLRFGDLAALEWSDVNLLDRELRITKAYENGSVTAPKTKRSRRTVDLTAQAAGLLEQWFVESGGRGLVFEREEGDHVRNDYVLRRVLYPAMDRAGIPRVGERGGARTFHSFRDTFSRIALENGAPMQWVSRQLGHSSIAVTDRHYGEWARSAEKREAEKLAAAFPV